MSVHRYMLYFCLRVLFRVSIMQRRTRKCVSWLYFRILGEPYLQGISNPGSNLVNPY